MSTTALQLSNVTAYHGAVPAVRNVSLRVDQGQAVGILGPNGAGKSTLLAAAAGFLRATGLVLVGGEDVAKLTPRMRRKAGLALVPQSQAIVTELTVGENLRLSWLTGMRSKKHDEAVAEALEIFPALADRLTEPAGNLSGGQRQMLAVSRGLMGTCDVLMLDEPTAGLSPKLIRELTDAIGSLVDRGCTVLLVEQNLAVVERTCQRTYVLSGGQVVWEGDTSDIDRERIGDFYAGIAHRPPSQAASADIEHT